MSKDRGQKIVVKFNKSLLGDVTGNESAFTITGMQRNPLGVGELELKTYTPSTVERYPIATLYEDDFSGAMDGTKVGVNGVALASDSGAMTYEKDETTPSAGSGRTSTNIVIKFKDTVEVMGFWVRVNTATTYGLTVGGIETIQATAATQNTWLYFELNEIAIFSASSSISLTLTGSYLPFYRAGAYSGSLWETIGGTWQVGNSLLAGISVIGESTYSSFGTYTTTTPTDTLPTNPRLKWTEDLPTGTSITAEYAVNQDDLTTPEAWTAINSDDLLTIPDPSTGYFLWLRFTLAITDTAVTPTLLSVWLEEAQAPPDTILLTFDTYNRFNDVEGVITVAYNQSLGTLAGTRPVESFSVDFTPADLEHTPIDEHTVTAGIDLTVDLIDLEFTEIYADHTVTHTATAGVDLTVALIDIDDINP